MGRGGRCKLRGVHGRGASRHVAQTRQCRPLPPRPAPKPLPFHLALNITAYQLALTSSHSPSPLTLITQPGERHSVGGASYGHVRIGAMMGRAIALSRAAAKRGGEAGAVVGWAIAPWAAAKRGIEGQGQEGCVGVVRWRGGWRVGVVGAAWQQALVTVLMQFARLNPPLDRFTLCCPHPWLNPQGLP